MGTGRTLLLGAIAGSTILLGMPLGRMKTPAPRLRQLLNATAIGILVFLLWDVLAGAFEPIDAALGSYHEGHGGLGKAVAYAAIAGKGAGEIPFEQVAVAEIRLVRLAERLHAHELDAGVPDAEAE